MDDAQARAHAGDPQGAEVLWKQVVDAAVARGDEATLDKARRALAELAFQQGDYAGFSTLQEARQLAASQRQDARILADVRMQLALLLRRQGKLTAARLELTEVIKAFAQIGDRDGQGQALTHMALVFQTQGDFVQALEALDDALALNHAGAQLDLDRIHHYRGLLYHALDDNEEARRSLKHGLSEARTLADPMRAAPLLGSLARISNDSQAYQQALAYTEQAGELSQRFGSVPGQAYSALERARALIGLERFEEARAAAQEARRLARSVSQERTEADAIFVLGRIARRAGDDALALRLFRQALPNYEAANDTLQTLDAYRQMVPLLLAQDEPAEAARLAGAALELQEQLNGREISRRLALAEYRHQVADDGRRIELLQRQNEVQQLRLKNQVLDRRIGMVLILALGSGGALLAAAFLRSRQIRIALAASNQALERNRVALAQANALLSERADVLATAAATDALTRISNRAHILDRLEEMAAIAFARHDGLAVLMIDVDHFKQVNDTFGHGIGDEVLRRVASLMQSLVPEGAHLGRYGGEEFLLLLPIQELERARALAERIRLTVEASVWQDLPPVTISIGVAAWFAGRDLDPDALIEEADQALYRAKAAGRNRIEVTLRAA